MIALGCVTGRFQPAHIQHVNLFEIALAECRHVIVAVTNPDTGARHEEAASPHRHTAAANPFTYFERVRLLQAAVREAGYAERMTFVPFDLTRRDFWPQYVPLHARHFVRTFTAWEREKVSRLQRAGYDVRVVEGEPSSRISAGGIRASISAGNVDWHSLVPAATQPLIDEFLAHVPMARRS